MSAGFDLVGVLVVLLGVALLALEFIHPGALLLIPGSILVVGGMLFLLLPDVLLNSPWGLIVIALAASGSALLEIPYYRWIAPTHGPMTTTSAGFTGEIGTIVADVVPDSLKGKVRVRSEIWSVQGERPIPVGTKVRVVGGEGVSLRVVPIEEAEEPAKV
ncbi:MAG TPA: NfeD family protein [Thermoplasmata archaeon]|nr:NfeD family protein [Thermoplasmata archaeon]